MNSVGPMTTAAKRFKQTEERQRGKQSIHQDQVSVLPRPFAKCTGQRPAFTAIQFHL